MSNEHDEQAESEAEEAERFFREHVIFGIYSPEPTTESRDEAEAKEAEAEAPVGWAKRAERGGMGR